jgi:hypothetical protein
MSGNVQIRYENAKGVMRGVNEEYPLPVTNSDTDELEIDNKVLLAAVSELTDQMKLLNARFEEAFRTGINKDDI